jgi:hypothetical protein
VGNAGQDLYAAAAILKLLDAANARPRSVP